MPGTNFNETTRPASTGGAGGGATEWLAFTPTGSWTTNVTYTGVYRQIGDMLYCQIKIALSGAPDNVSLSINLPAGFEFDFTKAFESGVPSIGTSDFYDADPGVTYNGIAVAATSTSVGLRVLKSDATYLARGTLSASVPFTWASGDQVYASFSVPVDL